ncbi:MAG TPA: PEGA domain-containing protein [Chlamydiales bacterium]|nr:PEGA domain-containing protein [Chlamydiales bacterium]
MRFLNHFWKLCLFFSLCSSLTSCASIINGPRQQITVSSNPPGVAVTDGVTTWITPVKLSLPRAKAHVLTFYKRGYKPQTVKLTRKISGATFGNIIMPLGLIAWGIDVASGAQWKLIPEKVDVTMEPGSPLSLPPLQLAFKQRIEKKATSSLVSVHEGADERELDAARADAKNNPAVNSQRFFTRDCSQADALAPSVLSGSAPREHLPLLDS